MSLLTTSSTVKVVPSIVRCFVHEYGLMTTALLPPHCGTAPAGVEASAEPASAAPSTKRLPPTARSLNRSAHGRARPPPGDDMWNSPPSLPPIALEATGAGSGHEMRLQLQQLSPARGAAPTGPASLAMIGPW